MSSMRPPHIHTCRARREREDGISASNSLSPLRALTQGVRLDSAKAPFTEVGMEEKQS